MGKPGASTILLLILGAFLLMLGFSGRFKDIFQAAFPAGSTMGKPAATAADTTSPIGGNPPSDTGTVVPGRGSEFSGIGSGGVVPGTGTIAPDPFGSTGSVWYTN